MIQWTPGLTLADVERLVILKAFRYFQGNKTKTANALHIAIRTLDYKLEEYGESKNSKSAIQADVMGDATGICPQSAPEAPKERELPVRKPEEVQEMLSRKAPKNHSKQRHVG